MHLIVGLGNPGTKYAKNRHNAGFMLIDKLAAGNNFSSKFDAHISQATFDGQKVLLMKPQTYMNLSGKSVLSAMAFYKIKPENIYVAYDDMDLALSKVRIQKSGGSGGHNGMKSIIGLIGQNFTRIRIGIGKPQFGVTDHVLDDFSEDEMQHINAINNIIYENIGMLISQEFDKLMNKCAMYYTNINKE